jgi:hypothetical protein
VDAAASAFVVAIAIVVVAAPARADSCTGVTDTGGRFATCFDPGNRLALTADTGVGAGVGVGIGIAVRHTIEFEDDPDLEWKMTHVMLDGSHDTLSSSFDGILYRGIYLRHSRDGHIVLPLGAATKKIWLPFDIGALAEVGNIDWRTGDPTATLGVFRVAPLVDFARARSHRAVLAIGPSAHWDVAIDPEQRAVSEHRVAPFTEGLVDLHLESFDGLYVADARVEAGTAWRSDAGWRPEVRAEASIERTIIALNDRPVALTLGIRYDSVREETVAAVGARFVLVGRTDPRVHLTTLAGR